MIYLFICLVWYILKLNLLDIFLHRAMHGSLIITPGLRFFIRYIVGPITGIDAILYFLLHEDHHTYADKKGDPHSPYLLKGWQQFIPKSDYVNRYIKNIKENHPETLDKIEYYNVGSITLITKVFGAKGLSILPILLYGILGYILQDIYLSISLIVAHMLVFVVAATTNATAHLYGKRPFKSGGFATNNQWHYLFGILTASIALHNTHHVFPRSARYSVLPGDFDINWPFMCLLEILGLLQIDRTGIPSQKQVQEELSK